MSDALDNLSTVVGCYMHRHTFVCWKLLLTYIFSGFQKQLLAFGSRETRLYFVVGRKTRFDSGLMSKRTVTRTAAELTLTL